MTDHDIMARTGTVLIIDPNSYCAHGLKACLESAGYDVTVTDDPLDALRHITAHRPGVIIGEHPLHLPDGRKLCEALLEDPATAGIPFVALTARAFPEEVRDAERTHPEGVLTKPVTPGRLLQCVDALAPPGHRPGRHDG
jgi:CheY-like chemotaxis protein